MSKIYNIKTIKTRQDLKVTDYNLFENPEQINNLSPTYMGILKIFREVFKQIDFSKIIKEQ